MRPVCITAAAATDAIPLSIDRACQLDSIQPTTRCTVSTDQTVTVAGTITTPATTGQIKNVIFAASTISPPNIAFPLSEGEVIYVGLGAAGNVVLFFTDL